MILKRKPFENIVGKGENAGNWHFLLFPQCFLTFPKQISVFQSHLFCRVQKLLIWTSLEILLFGKELTLYHTTIIQTGTKSKHLHVEN